MIIFRQTTDIIDHSIYGNDNRRHTQTVYIKESSHLATSTFRGIRAKMHEADFCEKLKVHVDSMLSQSTMKKK